MKKKSFAQQALALLLLVSLSSCNHVVVGEDPVVDDTRDIHKFSKVELDIDAEVIVTYGADAAVIVRAQRTIADAIKTEISGKTLRIESKKILETDEPIQIILTMNNLELLELNGSGTIISTNTLNATNLKLSIKGSGKINVDVVSNTLKTNVSGSGDVELKGSARTHNIDINGSGKLGAANLMTEDCKIDINGSGDARVYVTGSLDASISGSGNVYYKGGPQVKKDISGSGHVGPMN